jgi:RNA polymerase sigma-54 factor
MPQVTPMVRAAIGLLVLSNLEIDALLRDRLSRNPWLVEYPMLPFPSDAPIECDVIVAKRLRGYGVCLNDCGVPLVGVRALSEQDRMSKAACRLHNEAAWLVKSLDRRREILQKVAEAAVHWQAEFFEKGSEFLKPLTLRQLADQAQLHPSTVSRVTMNKTLFIESGHDAGQMLGLRALCATRPQTDALKHEVAALIKEETAADAEPLSDERIALLLRNRGYRIARRTVAKHRATLGIEHAYQRRRVWTTNP